MLKPLRNFIAIQERELPEKISTLIVLPNQVKEPVGCGEVMAVGPGKRLPNGALRSMPVKTGDRVLYLKRSAKAWFDPKFERDYQLIMDDDILGIVSVEMERAA